MSELDDRPGISSDVSDGPPRAHDARPRGESGPDTPPIPSSPGWTWLLVLAAGVLSGLAGFGIGEAAPSLVKPSYDVSPEVRRLGPRLPMEIERRRSAARDTWAMMSYGGLGMALGLTLGVAGGVARRSTRAAIAAGLIGLVLGGAAGAGATLVLVPRFHAARAVLTASDDTFSNDLGIALQTHGGIWLAVGAAAGLALGIGLGGTGRMARALIGGILGAAIASAIYEFGSAVLFPDAQTFRPMAYEVMPRLFAHVTVGLLVAAVALLVAEHMTLGRSTQKPNS